MNWCDYGDSEREYHKGDEIAWYADGGKTVRNEYNPATAYAFGTILGSFGFILILILLAVKILLEFGNNVEFMDGWENN